MQATDILVVGNLMFCAYLSVLLLHCIYIELRLRIN